jgi:hypothetical protein
MTYQPHKTRENEPTDFWFGPGPRTARPSCAADGPGTQTTGRLISPGAPTALAPSVYGLFDSGRNISPAFRGVCPFATWLTAWLRLGAHVGKSAAARWRAIASKGCLRNCFGGLGRRSICRGTACAGPKRPWTPPGYPLRPHGASLHFSGPGCAGISPAPQRRDHVSHATTCLLMHPRLSACGFALSPAVLPV